MWNLLLAFLAGGSLIGGAGGGIGGTGMGTLLGKGTGGGGAVSIPGRTEGTGIAGIGATGGATGAVLLFCCSVIQAGKMLARPTI